MKNNNKALILILFIAICSLSANAQKEEQARGVIDDFFIKYNKEGADNALDFLFSTNDWMQQQAKDDISNIKLKLGSLISLVGDYHGNEYITEKSIGQSFKLYSYIVKYDRQPIRFVFIFYKPNDKWMIYNFTYDQELTEELEDAAKAYRLKENLDF